ncbi:MAG TPA: Type 1 glutamine amidotransferase-like domain-containing protein [Gemmatimonadaceae bacterium]
MPVLGRVIVASLVAPALLSAQRAAPRTVTQNTPHVGPAHGTVIVVGGGAMGPEIYSRFIQAAGGPDALIIDVPNAGGGSAYGDDAAGARNLRRAGARNVRVLFTTDRAVANADSFVAIVKRAGGVWFEGGRQYRLVDAYAGTKTEQAFHDVLARGGVVGGSSAGATILGDFLVRGAPSNDNRIMDYPGYEKGFAFLRGVAIDQHVVARERLPDLADSIMPRYPRLLGMSEDEGTAWVVRGDTATIIGRDKAFVYGGHDATDPGKPFLTLYPGDRYDLATRHVLHRASDDAPFPASFIDGLFATYASGASGGATVLVARNGEVVVDKSYGIPAQPRYMPTTTLPQFPLGDISRVFTALCAQLPEPAARSAANGTRATAGSASRTRATRELTTFQRCVARQIATPIGLHRTTAEASGQVQSDVDELYRLALGLESPRTWPGVDVTRGWTRESHGGTTWLTAYAAAGGKRGAFIRIPDAHAVVIVLTNDDSADAKGLATTIAERLPYGT